MTIFKLKFINYWRDKKNIALLFIYILMIFSFFIYNNTKLKQEYHLLTSEMEEKLYIIDFDNLEDSDKAEFAMDYETLSALFHFRSDYLQNWKKQNIEKFQTIEEQATSSYVQYLEAIYNDGFTIVDEDEYPPSLYAINRVKQIKQLNSMKLLIQSSRYGNDGSSFVTVMMYSLTSFLGIFFFLFLFGDFISFDYEKQNIRLIFTTLTNKKTYVLHTLVLTMIHALALFCVVILISFVTGTLFNGVGQVEYPLISPSVSSLFLPTYYYWLQVFVLFFFVLLFSFICYAIFSLFLRNSIVSVLATVLFLLIMNRISVSLPLRLLAPFNPFTYLEVSNVFIGKDVIQAYFSSEAHNNVEYEMIVENINYYLGNNLSTQLNNPLITFGIGLIVLFISNICLFFVLNILVKRKSII